MNYLKEIFLLCILLILNGTVFSQHRIAGTIIDRKNNEPLVGANIYLEGTTYGTASDKEGKYEITDIPNGSFTLRASYHGYKTLEEKLEIYRSISSVHFRMEESSIDINAIVVTGTRREQQISKSSVLTQLIGKETINKQGITYLPQALSNNNASFEMVKDNTVSSFRFGGLAAAYSLFLIDGERIAGETKGAVDLSRINTTNIERIEIINGASSTLYGSNAIGGVVNIITRDVSRRMEVKGGVQTSLFKDPASKDGRSEEYAFANINLSRGKLTSFTNAKFNNYAPYDINGGDGTLGILTQENEDNYSITQKIVFRANDQWSLSGKASYYHLDRDYQLHGYPDKKSDDFSYGLTTSLFPWPKVRVRLSWHSDQNKIYDVLNLGTAKKDTIDYDNLFQNARFLGNFKIGRSNDITLGIEYIREQQSSAQNNFDSKMLENYVGYVQNETRLSKNLIAVMGIRIGSHSSYGTYFTPQLNTMFSPGKFTFRGNYGKGFRAPSAKELYTNNFIIPVSGSPVAFYLDGNPALDPETSDYYAASGQFSNEKIDISLSYTANEVSHLITSNSISKVVMSQTNPPIAQEIRYTYSNVEKARIKNLNLIARYQILNELSFNASYIFTDARNISLNEALPNIRKHNARLNLDYNHSFKKYALTANLHTSYFGSKKTVDIYNPENNLVQLPDYWLWQINTTHTFKDHYTFRMSVTNLFDQTDDQPAFFNLTSPGRMLILGISISF